MNVWQSISSVHWAESKVSTPRHNGRSVNQEGKHEIHMIINFRQVNIAICRHLQLSLNARSCICEGVSSTVGHSVATIDYFWENKGISNVLDKAVPLPSDSNQRCWAFLFIVVIIVLHMCLFFHSSDGRCQTEGPRWDGTECYISSEFLLFDLAKRWSATVLPTKSDSGVMLRLQSYQGLIIDRLRVY